jgi:REP element-mobilizing transposase RayT
MGRSKRRNLPGVAFHLTARIQGGAPLLEGVEKKVISLTASWAVHSDFRLIAYAVMRNHLHILAVQGQLPLGRLMQPLLTGIAQAVARTRKHEGHVFERRYYDRPCLDADYMRNAIAYIHLNPVRAGLCEKPDEYEWTSHRAYGGAAECDAPFAQSIAGALQLFGGPNSEASLYLSDYRDFIAWRLAADAARKESENPTESDDSKESLPPASPWCLTGDRHWMSEWSSHVDRAAISLAAGSGALIDLHRLAVRTLKQQEPGAPLSLIRSGTQTREVARVRRLVIATALSAGFRNKQIAAFLNTSPSVVSAVSAGLRADYEMRDRAKPVSP